MARVEYDSEKRPNRVILGYRKHSGTLYVVYPVVHEGVSFELSPALFAFQGTAANQVPTDTIPAPLRTALEAHAGEVLQHVLIEGEDSSDAMPRVQIELDEARRR